MKPAKLQVRPRGAQAARKALATFSHAIPRTAEMTTFLAPASKCADALSEVVKTPVDSQMYSAPTLAHGMSFGFCALNTATCLPFAMSLPAGATRTAGDKRR